MATRSRRSTRRSCRWGCRWRPRSWSRWSDRGSRTTCSRRCTPPIRTGSRCRRRCGTTPREATRSWSSRMPRARQRRSRPTCSRRSRTRSITCSRRASSARRPTWTPRCSSEPAGRSSSAGSRSTSTRPACRSACSGARSQRQAPPRPPCSVRRAMARDDWRIRIELREPEHATGFLARLGLELDAEANELARALEGRHLVVSHDGNEVFVYTASGFEAESARKIVQTELVAVGLDADVGSVEHWLHDEERWDDEPPGPTPEEELLAEGRAPWEVRIECRSREGAGERAARLEAGGYGVARRFRYVIGGTATQEEGEGRAPPLPGGVGAG